MGNCLSKCANKSFIVHTPPLTSGYPKKAASSLQKANVKYFTAGIYRNHRYERPTQNIQRSLKNVCNRFFPQSFEL